jgi:hypothetical protein
MICPKMTRNSMGYHKKVIKKGVFGEFSKIKEELEELEDAIEQDVLIMQMVELSDLFGAIREFAQVKFNLNIDQLEKMADLTESAFKDGTRK